MASMPWVKLYTEMLDDVKLARLPDALKWRFVSLIFYKSNAWRRKRKERVASYPGRQLSNASPHRSGAYILIRAGWQPLSE